MYIKTDDTKAKVIDKNKYIINDADQDGYHCAKLTGATTISTQLRFAFRKLRLELED